MALRVRPRVTLHIDQRQTTQAAQALPTLELTGSVLTVDVGPCCTEPPYVGSRPDPSPPPAADPSTAAETDRSLPVIAVVAITVGAALLLFAGIFLLFAYRRRTARRRQAAKMYPNTKKYQTVAARPETPPTVPSSPSSSSSLSTRALLDLGYCEDNNDAPSSPQPQPRDRRSVDTIIALRYYGHQQSRHSHNPSVAELPATPPPRPVPVPPPTPPSSTTPPMKARTFPRRKPIGSGKPIVYLNPAGEPWVHVPPPSLPLPAPPASQTPKRSSHLPRGRPRPAFSLFPPAHSPPARPKLRIQSQAWQLQPQPQPHIYRPPNNNTNNTLNNLPTLNPPNPNAHPPRNQSLKRNFSRPSPIKIHAPTLPLPTAPATAPLPSGGPAHGSGSGQPAPGNGYGYGRGGSRSGLSPPLTARPYFAPPPGQAGDGRRSGGWWGWGGWRSPGRSPRSPGRVEG
ncbi:hypothetical protein F5144DRAFT_197384 [Chaetomium tenue]|uniref:Uncharacterized protein n=1 Tax=Chaetomium tenue TaxID=1854479 RepID=A0ACB7PCB2_9PEZI|nr:hypothetical protein F5144DRAFT_197384 [Chaetomium globosum]